MALIIDYNIIKGRCCLELLLTKRRLLCMRLRFSARNPCRCALSPLSIEKCKISTSRSIKSSNRKTITRLRTKVAVAILTASSSMTMILRTIANLRIDQRKRVCYLAIKSNSISLQRTSSWKIITRTWKILRMALRSSLRRQTVSSSLKEWLIK